MIRSYELARAVLSAWPQSYMAVYGCAWVVDLAGEPTLSTATAFPALTIRSLVWDSTRAIPIVPISDLEIASRKAYTGREMRKRIEEAVRDQQEAPPFYVEAS